ncbi:MAG: hypothetical protein R3282_10385, partial [Rhodothermales bacterium]|nr:hypothetical protein [Rhodothermales bacterium]
MKQKAGKILVEDATVDSDETVAFIEVVPSENGSAKTTAERPRPDNNRDIGLGSDVLEALSIGDRVVKYLVRHRMVSDSVVREAHGDWKSAGETEPLWRVLARQKGVDQETVYAAVARIYGFRKAEIGEGRPDSGFVERIIHSFDEEQRVRFGELALIPLEYKIEPEKGILRLVFATPDPTSPEALRFIHDLNLDQYEVTYAPYRDLRPFLEDLFPKRNEFLDRLASDAEASATDIGLSYAEEGTQLVDEEALDAEINRSALVNLFEACLVEAVRQGASDIHVLPNPRRQTEFRFRIDGALRIWHTHSKTS